MFFKNLSSKLRKPGLTELLALLVFIVFIPSFLVSDEIMNGTRMAKEFGLSITLAIVLPIALILWTIYNWKDLSIGITKIDILVAIFAAYCGFLVWYHGYTDRIEIKFFMYGSAYILFRMFFSSFKKNTNPEYSWKNPRVYFPVLLSLILSAHCIIGLLQLYGVMNSYHAYFQVTGMFFNPAPYSGFLIALSPLCIATYMKMKKHKEKWGIMEKVAANLLLASFILTLSVLPVTQSRAAWLAFAGAMAFLVWRYYPVKEWWAIYFPKSWMKVTGISLAAVLIVSSAVGLYYYKKDSADGRLLIWKVSNRIVLDNPILGIGIGKFSSIYNSYQMKYFKDGYGSNAEKKVASPSNVAFNEPLYLVIEYGLAGFLLLLIIAIVYIRHNNNLVLFGNGTALASYFIFSLFSYPLSNPILVIILIILLVGLVSFSQFEFKFQLKGYNQVLYFLAVFIGCLIFYRVVLAEIKSKNIYTRWNYANIMYKFEKNQKSLNLYKSLFPDLLYNGEFLIDFGKVLSIYHKNRLSSEILNLAEDIEVNEVLYITLGDNYKSMGLFKDALEYYNCAASLYPSRLYPKYLKAMLMDSIGEKDNAIIIAREILDMKVEINTPAINEIREKMHILINKHKQQ